MNSIADLKDPRIRVIVQENCGKAVALNNALKELSGEFYAIQDADDISYPQRIERQVDCMLENSKLAAVFTGYDLILGGRRFAPRFRFKSIQQCRKDIEQMLMPSHDPTAMFRVSLVKSIPYEPSLRVGQGWDYILRVGEQYPMMVLNECLYSYRCHGDSNTRKNRILREKKIKDVVSKACQRRGLHISKVLPPEETPIAKSLCKGEEYGIVPHFMESVLDLRRSGQYWRALTTMLECLRLHPFDPYYYKPLLYVLLPMALIRYYRAMRSKLQ